MKIKLAAIGAMLGLFYAISGYAGIEEANTAFDKGDYTKALQEARPLAQQGNAAAQKLLGLMYSKGKGLPQNYAEAIRWFRKAAQQGNAEAQFALGFMYDEGQGVSQDYKQAIEWYRKAVAQGYADAQNNLGNKYYFGKGVPQNFAEALKWFRKAAKQGRADAQLNLGNMYYLGKGVPQNFAEALKWFRKAAKQGRANAQFILGNMYYLGNGVPQDYIQATGWWKKAIEQGHADAQTNLLIAEEEHKKLIKENPHEAQSYFEHIRTSKVEPYTNAINEIQKSAIFNQANAETSAFISNVGTHFAGWSGKLSTITTSHGGKDVYIAIDSSGGATYKININATLGSRIYQQVSSLKEGQLVSYSGTIIPADDDSNHWERSATELGSLLNPEFRVEFDNIDHIKVTKK